MTALATVVPETRTTGPRLAWLRDRGMGASVLVAGLSSAFGVFLVEITASIGAVLQADPFIGDSGAFTAIDRCHGDARVAGLVVTGPRGMRIRGRLAMRTSRAPFSAHASRLPAPRGEWRSDGVRHPRDGHSTQ